MGELYIEGMCTGLIKLWDVTVLLLLRGEEKRYCDSGLVAQRYFNKYSKRSSTEVLNMSYVCEWGKTEGKGDEWYLIECLTWSCANEPEHSYHFCRDTTWF